MKVLACSLTVLLFTLVARADSARPAGPNLLRGDPSFEKASGGHGNGNYTILGWTGVNYRWGGHGPCPGAPGAGNQGWRVDNSGDMTTTPDANAPVAPGHMYTVSFQARKTQDNPDSHGSITVRTIWYDAAGKEIVRTFGPAVLDGGVDPTWRTYSHIARAPAHAATAGVEIFLDGGAYPHEDGRTFELDDVQLFEQVDRRIRFICTEPPWLLSPARTPRFPLLIG